MCENNVINKEASNSSSICIGNSKRFWPTSQVFCKDNNIAISSIGKWKRTQAIHCKAIKGIFDWDWQEWGFVRISWRFLYCAVDATLTPFVNITEHIAPVIAITDLAICFLCSEVTSSDIVVSPNQNFVL